MDPDEVMRQLRDAMIEISDLVSTRLQLGGSSLNPDKLEQAVESAEKIVERAGNLLAWLGNGGFPPGQH